MCSAARSLSGLHGAARAAAHARSPSKGPALRLPKWASEKIGIFTFFYDHSFSLFSRKSAVFQPSENKQTGLGTVFFRHRARRAGGVIVHIMFFFSAVKPFPYADRESQGWAKLPLCDSGLSKGAGLSRRCRQARNGSRPPCTFPARSVRAGSNVHGGSPPPASRSSRPGRRRRAGRSGAPGCGRW